MNATIMEFIFYKLTMQFLHQIRMSNNNFCSMFNFNANFLILKSMCLNFELFLHTNQQHSIEHFIGIFGKWCIRLNGRRIVKTNVE